MSSEYEEVSTTVSYRRFKEALGYLRELLTRYQGTLDSHTLGELEQYITELEEQVYDPTASFDICTIAAELLRKGIHAKDVERFVEIIAQAAVSDAEIAIDYIRDTMECARERRWRLGAEEEEI